MSQPRRSPVRLVLIACALLVAAGAVVLLPSERAQRATRLRAAEAIGDVASARVAEASGASASGTEGQHERAADLISVPVEVKKLNDYIYQARAVGNTHLVATSEGNVVFDTGLVIQGAKQQFPNVFTMRGEKVRKPVEYIESLEMLIALEPEMIVPSHDAPITGKEGIRNDMVRMRDAVRFVHDATIAGMNAGKTVHQLMGEIVLPPEFELRQVHGRVSWAVRSIWEYYATWFHFDTTTELYPVPDTAVYGDLAELAGADALVERARRHLDEGRAVHALHLLDVVLGAEPDHRAGLAARKDALESLIEDAEGGLRNSYEIDFLQSRLRATNEVLGISGGPA